MIFVIFEIQEEERKFEICETVTEMRMSLKSAGSPCVERRKRRKFGVVESLEEYLNGSV